MHALPETTIDVHAVAGVNRRKTRTSSRQCATLPVTTRHTFICIMNSITLMMLLHSVMSAIVLYTNHQAISRGFVDPSESGEDPSESGEDPSEQLKILKNVVYSII